MVSSDTLFSSFTIAWFTTCMWVVKKPSWGILLLQALLLYACFSLRYTAMFYPGVAIIAFLCCRAKWWYKAAGISLSVLVISCAVFLQENVVEEETGIRIYSGFSGWQLANNALCCYKYTGIQSTDLPTFETQVIDHLVKQNIDSVVKSDSAGCQYMWEPKSPLKKYANLCAYRHHTDYLITWFQASVPLSAYGWYIIRNYPGLFTRHFLWPNTVNYFYPSPEVLTNYDYKYMLLPPETKQWFNFKDDHLDCTYPLLQGKIMAVYPLCSLLVTVLNLLAIVYFSGATLPCGGVCL